MEVNVLLFGQLRDIAGRSELVMKDVRDSEQLVVQMLHAHPGLAAIKFMIAVNKKVITGNTLLENNSIVALLPPFSGG